jgi:hypothetical protein
MSPLLRLNPPNYRRKRRPLRGVLRLLILAFLAAVMVATVYAAVIVGNYYFIQP